MNDKGLSIVVSPPNGGLQTEAIKIKDIAVSETDVKVENIRIINRIN